MLHRGQGVIELAFKNATERMANSNFGSLDNSSAIPSGCQPINDGDTGMMMMATTFVMLQTPAMGLAQAGIIRRKNALSMLMQTLTGFCIGSLLWFTCGFSLTFGRSIGHAGILGNLENAFLDGVSATHCYPNSTATTIPGILFAAFQMMFAIMVPVIVTGAWAERMLFEAFLCFVVLWPFLVYYPLAHWIWNTEGWLATWGVLDFAGGLTIHTSTGVAALSVTLVLSGRLKVHGLQHHNLPLAILGGSIIWGAWYSFNGGSAYKANGQAAIAVMNTHISACASALIWTLASYYRDSRWHLTEIMNGAFAGLAAITPGSGFVNPQAALLIGVGGGIASYGWVSHVKPRLKVDDTLDVAALQGVPGIFGSLALGLFASKPYSPTLGLFYGGGGSLLLKQSVAVCITICWSFCLTYILMIFIRRAVGIDVSADAEERGLDISQIGEQAYDDALSVELDLGSNMLTTQLCEACSSGDLPTVKSLLRKGAKHDAHDYDMRTPLHLAASENHLHILQFLIKQYHYDVNAEDKYGNTPLADAVKADAQESAQFLREHGGTVAIDSGYFISSNIYSAAALGNLEEVRSRIQHEPTCVHDVDYDQRTPLHLAAAEGHTCIIRELLNAGCKINAVDRWGNTPYNEAIRSRHQECAQILSLQKTGGSATQQCEKKGEEYQPLLEMSTNGPLSPPELVATDQLNAADRAILHAADAGDVDELQRLLKRGANVNTKDYDDRSVLHLVCTRGHLSALRVLLSSPNLTVDCFDRFGATPLQDAVLRGHTDIAAMLRSAGATIVNVEQGTRLCRMAASNNLTGLKALEATGTDINVCDYDGRTAMHLAACQNHIEITTWLLQRGAKANSHDRHGNQPIDDARRYGHDRIAQLLSDYMETLIV